MNTKLFRCLVAVIGIAFTLAFCIIVVPAFLKNSNLYDAFMAGFVNPFAAGFALDVIACWLILCVWMLHERREGMRYWWVVILLGIVPGVAAALSAYLFFRLNHDRRQVSSDSQ